MSNITDINPHFSLSQDSPLPPVSPKERDRKEHITDIKPHGRWKIERASLSLFPPDSPKERGERAPLCAEVSTILTGRTGTSLRRDFPFSHKGNGTSLRRGFHSFPQGNGHLFAQSSLLSSGRRAPLCAEGCILRVYLRVYLGVSQGWYIPGCT